MRGAGPRDARGRFVRAAPRRSANLRVIGNTVDHVEPISFTYKFADGHKVKIRRDVPRTRGDCPVMRPCPHVRCEMHLARTDGADRPGRRHANHIGARNEYVPTIKLSVLRGIGPSCALDVIDAHPAGMSSGEVGKLLGLSKRAVELVVKKARDRYHASGHEQELEDPVSVRDGFAEGCSRVGGS